jgi:hypothetical protein
VTGRWFSPVSSTNQTERHDKTEILLKVALHKPSKTIFATEYNLNESKGR